MTGNLARAAALPLLLLVWACFAAAPALADEVSAEERVELPTAAEAEEPEAVPEPPLHVLEPSMQQDARAVDAAVEDWHERRHWRYGTQNFFSLTRGMDDAGIPRWAQYPLYLLTVPVDLAQSPFAAIGGLFGS
jgi:hypothetical protein